MKEENIFGSEIIEEIKAETRKKGLKTITTMHLQKSDSPEKTKKSKVKISWADLSDGHFVGEFIDEFLGANWISMGTSEIIEKSESTEFEIDIMDIIDFSNIAAIKKKKNELATAMLEFNMESSVNQKIADGADMKDIKAAKTMFSQVEDDGRTYVYLQTPTQHQNADVLEHTCVSCGNKIFCEEFRRNKKDEK